MGANRAEIENVKKLGYLGWIEAQMSMSASGSRWDWLIAKGFNGASYKNSEAGFDSVVWRNYSPLLIL